MNTTEVAAAAAAAASEVAAAKAAAVAAGVTANLTNAGNSSLSAWPFEHVLVTLALVGVLITVVVAALVVVFSGNRASLETRKIRFAAATFTGILILFVFTAVLYFADVGAVRGGKEIFEKAITAMTPLAGVIVGYLFGTKGSSNPESNE